MIEDLERLSYALGSISRDDARRVCEIVNRKLMDLLAAQVIKIYWTAEAEDGILLSPIAFINNAQRQEDPRPFQVTPEHKGILPWVFRARAPLWLENLRGKDLTTSVRNEATGQEVAPEYLDMRSNGWIDSMMVVPLPFRGDVRGLHSIELQTSGRLNHSILDLLRQIARPLARLLWDMDVFVFNQERASYAVSTFLNSVGNFSFDSVILEGEVRTGFIARPFAKEFSVVEERITTLLKSKGIRATAYKPEGGARYIIDDIQKQIRRSHFCIADMTGLNANVVAEVAMMIVLRKHFILMRRQGDATPIPFDFNQYQFFEYEATGADQGLRVWDTSQNRYQPFSDVLDRFIERVPPETGFASAQRFRSD